MPTLESIRLTKYKLPEASPTQVEYMLPSQLGEERGNELLFDVECYRNFFTIGFMSYVTGRVFHLEQSDFEIYDINRLRWIVENTTLVGFNSKNYDMPMLWASYAGLNCGQLYALSGKIIYGTEQLWRLEKQFKFKQYKCDHIDLQQIAPAAPQYLGLRQYGGRMHVPKIQDLPFHPSEDLTYEQCLKITNYNVNDLVITGFLRYTLDDAIRLRKTISSQYGVDVRSLSDAQIAEKVIATEIQVSTGFETFIPKVPEGTIFRFKQPDYIRFYTEDLISLYDRICSTNFVVDEDGNVKVKEGESRISATNLWSVKIGKSTYNLGIGGLHSTEHKQTVFSDNTYSIFDRDVASYYPAIILNQKLFPSHLGPAFLQTYHDIWNRRIAVKNKASYLKKAKSNDPLTKRELLECTSQANSLKISLNGCFGKLGSRYSVFYSPDLLCQVTLTGQLSLLMLIEMLELNGITVVSANTDGIVIKCKNELKELYLSIVADWERITNFVTEESRYQSIHSRDVNNYIAITCDGEIKAKGAYTNDLSFKDKNRESLMTNPNGTIVTEAVMLFLKTCRGPNPITIDETIKKCKDIRKFIFVRRVKGGAEKDGVYLGKVVRWYIKQEEYGEIKNASPNKAGIRATVSETLGGNPIMDILDFPKDVDYTWYIRRAHSILKEIGYYGNSNRQLDLFE